CCRAMQATAYRTNAFGEFMYESTNCLAVAVHGVKRYELFLLRLVRGSRRRCPPASAQFDVQLRQHPSTLSLECAGRDIWIAKYPDSTSCACARSKERQMPLTKLLCIINEKQPRRSDFAATHQIGSAANHAARTEFIGPR